MTPSLMLGCHWQCHSGQFVLVSRHDSKILECLKGCESPESAVVVELESQDHGVV